MPLVKCGSLIRWYRTYPTFPIAPIDCNTPVPTSALCNDTGFDFVAALVVGLVKARSTEPGNRDVHMPANGLFRIKANPKRWKVLVLVALLYMIIYLEKSNIAVAAPAISQAFGLSKSQMGMVFSAFVLAYTVGQIPCG
jgi:fucose permease